ncbi:uncharacterized protein APUU_41079A [Aspergillus puulaauensis]|uniref:Uncharacterized protein n=1 Tax=Aspergillus puulaauensis TaxID=1220207 RepID=A0A7R7XNA6_9EURO|nr:uncharacterized protein APUU_41079A [Aspergillus puulaauensis]BCS24635.1 hypothetical protein APUU_41079A [Aspergillus puulaauensis]
MSCLSSKRQREHDEFPVYNEDLVREKKKHRSLPLRSPRKAGESSKLVDASPRNPLSVYPYSALTPIESSDEDDPDNLYLSSSNLNKSQEIQRSFDTSGLDCDASMDLDVSEDSGSVDKDTKNQLSAAASDGDDWNHSSNPHNIIHHSLSTSHIAATPCDSLNSQQPTVPIISVSDSTVSPSHSIQLTEDTLWWRCPRLLSPVSDNGDSIPGAKDSSDDSEMVYDTSPPESLPSLGSGYSSAMDAEAADMRQRLSSLDLPGQANIKPSGHLKPPKKPGFSMGYRADCDKCRRKVPGHYSHIIGC